ncbi:MAG: His/Gly/Thr/Pro-type tRNA ligase C-terminal domain-containing protein [bacterium]|nr:His/Gly/Thr/Pro-type tRNA ligase C-terminal domain-containing protein [bacterium]
MLQSQLFTKTKKDAPKDEVSNNAQLLIRGGFINKEMAGVYSYLPLGLKVLNKIINIIRQEMNEIGGQEVLLGSLQDPTIWQKTDRWDDKKVGIWFKSKLNAGGEVGLANTHEEPMVVMLKQHINSYKDLPVYTYQFQNKFRNELRAKSGIMRTREFIMKDMYSFSKNQEDLDTFYEQVAVAYTKIFERCGIGAKTYKTFASGGIFSKFSHEFQTVSAAGEDTIYISKEKNIAINDEVYNDQVLNDLRLKKEDLEKVKAIEIGNIFKLGNRFSSALGLQYTDDKGERNDVIMGCYGIGPGRLMGTIVELLSQENKINWPKEVSPFDVHIIGLSLDNEEVTKLAQEKYKELTDKGIDVLFDDRLNISAGQKFADADLIGIPERIIIGKESL